MNKKLNGDTLALIVFYDNIGLEYEVLKQLKTEKKYHKALRVPVPQGYTEIVVRLFQTVCKNMIMTSCTIWNSLEAQELSALLFEE